MSKKQANLNEEIAAKVTDLQSNILAGEAIGGAMADYLQQYSGDGGLLKFKQSRDSLYAYYTPYPIVEAMWQLAYKYGFTSGKILEPSAGIGRFIKYVDPTANTVDAYQFSKDTDTSFLICKACYPWVNISNDYFESIFYKDNKRVAPEPSYDLVIGNPPYGAFSGLYAGPKREGRVFPGVTYDQYFIWAGIELLKAGGLLVFIIPSTFLQNNSNYGPFKQWLTENAELMEAYRLPKGVFDFTEIMTDIIVFKKK